MDQIFSTNQLVKFWWKKDNFQDIQGSEVNENINTNLLSKTQVTTFNWKQFSDYKKLLHRIAYLKLFARTCKSKLKVRKSDKTSTSSFSLSNDIIRDTENFIILAIQKEVFANEISQLKNNQQIVSTSMSKLNPIYCSDLIKVGDDYKTVISNLKTYTKLFYCTIITWQI